MFDLKDNFTHIIYGEQVGSLVTRTIINPATEDVIATVPVATHEQLDNAINAASRAFKTWSIAPVEQRQACLSQMAELLQENFDGFVELLIMEVGKARLLANVEVGSCVDWLKAYATQSLPEETIVDIPERKVITRYVPLGVCAAITPWNFPFSLMMWKLAPALLTGNCLIVKPSPFAPLCAMKFVELAQQVLPPGVLSVISGDHGLGPSISAHPGIARISLTGSIEAGKSVMKVASSDLKSITLELGGNDAAIVLEDAEIKDVAVKLFWGSLHNSGQICVAIKRIYIHEKIYSLVRDEIVAYARTIKVGNGIDPTTGIGPVQNTAQLKKVWSIIDDCKSNGYNIVLGGEKPQPRSTGYFVPITIVDNPPDNSRIVQEEPFGPVLPLLSWKDDDDVIKRANDSVYGLAASVWGKDLERAQRIARRLEAGTVWINESQAFHWNQAFGGFKHSGLGVEHSKHGMYAWTNIQSITLKL